jgi:hypothetical protein
MTEWSKKLNLEDNEEGYRFDLRKLTVVANRDRQPVLMKDMGGDSPLWCHLIALLALHKYFVKEKSPVPNFLILDRPAQHYSGSEGEIRDIDRIKQMFKLFFDVCKDLAPNFQIIVLENVNLENDPEFQAALVEEYWTGEVDKALIPQSWLGPQK